MSTSRPEASPTTWRSPTRRLTSSRTIAIGWQLLMIPPIPIVAPEGTSATASRAVTRSEERSVGLRESKPLSDEVARHLRGDRPGEEELGVAEPALHLHLGGEAVAA